jgi:hypothetical protein
MKTGVEIKDMKQKVFGREVITDVVPVMTICLVTLR